LKVKVQVWAARGVFGLSGEWYEHSPEKALWCLRDTAELSAFNTVVQSIIRPPKNSNLFID